ncbi:hypothetical protein QFZ37_003433 [Chryseobacterium ginsenosidimutans]|uniref:DUF2490 domain-containing protein n=1 Tax=Chryseobacterium ginsenosidimutans TaxID=687846 RepID=UPI0027810C1F|nr:DUF2490 domain-containing protein [Chryseobacterium ginsenosidimutans]MDQ0595064.1 hypothetical protein [Chryseobacterium ginsenosidimutans]
MSLIKLKIKPNLSGITMMFILILGIHLKAQDIDGVSSFFVGGVSIDIPKNNKLLLYTGYSPTDNVKAFLALPSFKINKYLTLTPGYTYVNVDLDNGTTLTEHQLLAMATLNFPIEKNWTLADRNTYFHRFRNNLDDLSFYRNRLGIIHKTEVLKKEVSIFLHDEMYLSLDTGQFTRNRVILGGDIKLLKWLTPQIMLMYQSDKTTGNKILGWLVFTVPLGKI